MNKIALLLFFASVSIFCKAGEWSCEQNQSTYISAENNEIKICGERRAYTNFQFKPSSGAPGCAIFGNLTGFGNSYHYLVDGCRIALVINKSQINAKFSQSCDAACGGAASYSGEYLVQ